MCGRAYETYTEEELYWHYLGRKPLKLEERRPNYNLAPTQMSPIVLIRNGEKSIEHFRWGLVPAWAKTVKDADKYSMINAKSEEIATKRSYKSAFIKRRCIVPVSGFFEWQRTEDKKRPFAIHLKDEAIMSLAGIWEHWTSEDESEIVDSFAIITTAANSFMEKVHARMPAILGQKEEDKWLDPETQDPEELKGLLKPCPSSWLAAQEVSTLVNSPKNNVPEVLDPLRERP